MTNIFTSEKAEHTIFFQNNRDTNKSGWYIETAGGHVFGPFSQKEVAETILNRFLEHQAEKNLKADILANKIA